MTKVMTVLVAAEQAEKNAIAAAENENTEIDRQAVIENKLNEVVTITREATDYSYVHDCSTTGFLDGEQVPLRDVFNGTILPSGGESAYQLAVYTAGSMEAFVDMMNQKAAELGIGQTTHFANLSAYMMRTITAQPMIWRSSCRQRCRTTFVKQYFQIIHIARLQHRSIRRT